MFHFERGQDGNLHQVLDDNLAASRTQSNPELELLPRGGRSTAISSSGCSVNSLPNPVARPPIPHQRPAASQGPQFHPLEAIRVRPQLREALGEDRLESIGPRRGEYRQGLMRDGPRDPNPARRREILGTSHLRDIYSHSTNMAVI